jgi:allantoate deiminase
MGTVAGWRASAERAVERCHTLAAHSDHPGHLTRTFLSPAMLAAYRELAGWMAAAGLAVRSDAAGNLIGRRTAADPDAPVLLIGSHLDTVRNAGRYDGILGVTTGLALAETLPGPLPFHLDVIAFSEEEGVRFGATYFGSSAVCGRFDPGWLQLRDPDGVTLAEAIRAADLDPDTIDEAAYDPQRLLGYLELHIEQGPHLEALDRPVGVVEAIAGQSRLDLRFDGRANHAGTTPMSLRRDALAGAAELVLAIEASARALDGLVATVGRLEVVPGAGNVIPGRAHLSLDLRHRDDGVRKRAVRALLDRARAIADRRGLGFDHTTLLDEESHAMDPAFSAGLAARGQLPLMVSGAGHDAAVMSAFTRCALLFVRSPGGVSHHPDERVAVDDVAVALATMATFIQQLADERRPDPS